MTAMHSIPPCHVPTITVLQDPLDDPSSTFLDGKDDSSSTAKTIQQYSPDSRTYGAPKEPPPLPSDAVPALDAASTPVARTPVGPPPSDAVPALDAASTPVACTPVGGANNLRDAVTAALDALPLPPADIVNVFVGGSDSPSPPAAAVLAAALIDDDEPPSLLVQAPTCMGECRAHLFIISRSFLTGQPVASAYHGEHQCIQVTLWPAIVSRSSSLSRPVLCCTCW